MAQNCLCRPRPTIQLRRLPLSPRCHPEAPRAAGRAMNGAGSVPEVAPCRRRGAGAAGGLEAAVRQACLAQTGRHASPDIDAAPDRWAHCAYLDAAAFARRANVDQVDAARLSALSPLERRRSSRPRPRVFSIADCAGSRAALSSRAVAATPIAPKPHAGLARSASAAEPADAAAWRAHQALDLKPSAHAYLVLGRLDLAAQPSERRHK